jgi:hypothetical protein
VTTGFAGPRSRRELVGLAASFARDRGSDPWDALVEHLAREQRPLPAEADDVDARDARHLADAERQPIRERVEHGALGRRCAGPGRAAAGADDAEVEVFGPASPRAREPKGSTAATSGLRAACFAIPKEE